MCDTMLSIHIYEVFLHHLSYSQCFAENYSVTLSFSFEYSQWQETYHLLSQLILFGKSSPLESASWKLAQTTGFKSVIYKKAAQKLFLFFQLP